MGRSSVYNVTVTVTNAKAKSSAQNLVVTVTNVNEPPQITTAATVGVASGQLLAVDVQSTDPDGEVEGAGLSYRISGGNDQALFSIDANTGVVSFKSAPAFATPLDADKNNVYVVDVSVQDAANSVVTRRFNIGVTNVNAISNGDFGDAPSRYPVTIADNGARHTTGGLVLGAVVSTELNGQPSTTGQADAGDDGVFALATLFRSTVATTSSFSVISSGTGKLDAWIDFNNDGDWSDAGEKIFNSVNLVAGTNLLNFTVPANSVAGSTGARFRLSSAGGLLPTGAAVDGEVEDYTAAVITSSTSAVLDVDVPGGDTTIAVESDMLVVRKGSFVISRVPVTSFGNLKLNGSSLNDILELSILDALATKTLEFDGGIGKDFLELVATGQTLDLTKTNVSVRDVEGIDLRGTGNNKLVISIDAVKNASSTTDTLEVVSNAGDTITFGNGWKAEKPVFIDGQFTHVVSDAASGGTARVEIRNDRR